MTLSVRVKEVQMPMYLYTEIGCKLVHDTELFVTTWYNHDGHPCYGCIHAHICIVKPNLSNGNTHF